MNEVNLQNTTAKVSSTKDGTQFKGIKKADSNFKDVLENVSLEKKSLEASNSTVNDNKAEAIKDSKVEAADENRYKNSDGNSDALKNKTYAENYSKAEDVDDSKTSIKLSSKELADLEEFVEKLQYLVNKPSSDDKAEVKMDDVLQLFQVNLAKLNNALDSLRNKTNSDNQPSQIKLDLIDELSKMQMQITDIMSILSTSNVISDNQVSNDAKDTMNVDPSEHSMNAEKNNTKHSDILVELCGMASLLSQVAALKTEQIQNVGNKSEMLSKETLNEVKALNSSISVIKELLKNSNPISSENKKDYSIIAQAAQNVIVSKDDKAVAPMDNLKLKDNTESKNLLSNILRLFNNNEKLDADLKTGSEIEKLINKFVEQANEVGQKLKLSNEVVDSNLSKSPIQSMANELENSPSKLANKIAGEVRRKLENGDAVFDKEQNKFVIYEEKTDTSFKKETLVQTTNSDVQTGKSSLNKEDKLLLKLASDEKGTAKDDVSSKIARVTNLATSLQVEKNIPVEPTEKLPVVNRQTFNEDIVKSIKYMELNQVKELTVKVMPKELGELYIKITREGEVVKAQITATNKEAYNLLNSNLSDITKQLSEQNIKIHTFNVEIFNGDSGFYNQGSKNENGNSQSKRKNSFGSLEVDELGNTEDILNDFNNVNVLA